MTDNSYQAIGTVKKVEYCEIHRVSFKGECPLCAKGIVLKHKEKKQREKANIEFKTCAKCKSIKPISEFWVNKSNTDGYNYMCTDCEKEYQRERRETIRKEKGK